MGIASGSVCGPGASDRHPARGTRLDPERHDRNRPAAGEWRYMSARLAIVDDDAAFTEYLQTLLGSQGYAVEVFNSGTALLDGLRAGAAPNVVLLDVLMPDLDGLETLRAIRQARPAAQ